MTNSVNHHVLMPNTFYDASLILSQLYKHSKIFLINHIRLTLYGLVQELVILIVVSL